MVRFPREWNYTIYYQNVCGGTDDIENIECLNRTEHAKRHLELYNRYNDPKDYMAHCMLSGEYKHSVRKKMASIGGSIGGKIVAENNLGICTKNKAKKSKWGKIGGQASIASDNASFKQKNGIHDPILRAKYGREWSSIGGKKSPIFKDSKRQSEFGKSGGQKNKGFVWLTNGIKSIKYTRSMQENVPVDEFLLANPSYKRGRNLNKENNFEN